MLLRIIVEAIGKRQRRRKRSKAARDSNTSADDETKESTASAAKNRPLAYALARSWAWPALTFRCGTHPEEVSALVLDERGESLLHWALLGKPPLETVQAILNVCPEMAQVRNDAGHLPLHVAISYRSSVEVIRSLLAVFPESSGLANGVGAYPLHLLCDYGSSVDSLRALLETPAGAATVNKRMGRSTTALDMLNDRMNYPQFRRAVVSMREARKRQRAIREEMRQNQEQPESENRQQQQPHLNAAAEQTDASTTDRDVTVSLNVHSNNNNDDDDDNIYGRASDRGTPSKRDQAKSLLQRHERMIASFQQNDYWQKAAMILLVDYSRQPLPVDGLHDDNANIVHACAGVSNCNPHFMEFAILLHQDDLIQKRDANGRLPLHVAAVYHAASLLAGSDSTARSITQRMLLTVLEACPKAAFVQDDHGNLPLSLALQELKRSTPKPSSTIARAWSLGLQRLLDANLAALETLNLDERLYPRIFKRMTSTNELFLCIRRHPNLFQRKR